jgi:hypothetical protein
VGFHGKNTAIFGQINPDCTITPVKEIPSIFNDIE